MSGSLSLTISRGPGTGEWFVSHECAAGAADVEASARLVHGAALNAEIHQDPKTGRWRAGNGEYAVYVRFCPWCGWGLPGVTVGESTPGPEETGR